ncbi:MAG: hypothetical protein M5U28_19425 [Sandaracinaceae bacterium]|nr:hypothetical protein [Sandaracinaceae bacterium]
MMFPVHKYDNGFSAGDGNRSLIELGNFVNSGHYSNFTLDCPTTFRSVFDRGSVAFGGPERAPRRVRLAPRPST